MGFIEPFAIAPAFPSSVLSLGPSLLVATALISSLGIAILGIVWSAMPRRPRSLRVLRVVHSTAA